MTNAGRDRPRPDTSRRGVSTGKAYAAARVRMLDLRGRGLLRGNPDPSVRHREKGCASIANPVTGAKRHPVEQRGPGRDPAHADAWAAGGAQPVPSVCSGAESRRNDRSAAASAASCQKEPVAGACHAAQQTSEAWRSWPPPGGCSVRSTEALWWLPCRAQSSSASCK